ncbi:MAG: 50S ribosomal protein L7/L12 [Planctomycetaceae bacterium]|jgi:large subunit ribosomal protein L7/L12|nr:50S ribosomal protein L7/L12 [Planctomycetaceae bacterium]
MSDSAREFAPAIVELGEKIVALTLKDAKALSDYLEEVHGIKAAAGGAVVMAAPAGGADGGAAAAEEKTEFDVVLESFGEKKLDVIKEVRQAVAGISLGDAKKLVEEAPSNIKTGVSKEEAQKLKEAFEKVGAKIAIK